MGRHAFAEGLLSLLSVVAVIAGLLGLVGAAVLWQESGQAAFGLAVGSLVGTAALLALCQVGLVIVDIAESGRRSAEALVEIAAAERAPRAPEPARPAPSAAAVVPAPQSATASPAGEARRWQFLKDSDEEVAAAAGRMAALGPRWEAAMAERVLELGTGHLAGIERFIRAKADAEAEQAARHQAVEAADLDQLTPQARHELLAYRAAVEARDGLDPRTSARVASIEPYDGRWANFRGGVKVALEDGRIVLSRNSLSRVFASDPDREA